MTLSSASLSVPVSDTAGGESEELAQLAEKVHQARLAQHEWARTPLQQRLQLVRRFRQRLAGESLALAQLLAEVRGTSVAEKLAAELLPLLDACQFLEREAGQLLKPRKLGTRGRPWWLTGVQAEIHREPHGVILILGPSNYPLFLAGVQTVQALVAGNAVVWKPGTGGRAVADRLAALLYEAGLAPRLLVVTPESQAAGQTCLELNVDRVLLTGSAETGAAVFRQLAPRLIPATMELSGCDAVVVRQDADLDRVAQALRFSLELNRGETCIAPRRVFVPENLAPELERRLLEEVRQLPRLVSTSPSARRAAGQVRRALTEGGVLLTGELLPGDAGLTPVVLRAPGPECSLLHEEVFAPVVTLLPVRTEQAAVQAARDCPWALGASVFGGEAGARVTAGELKAGVVVVNDVIVPTADPRLPFGGLARSGFGVTRGREGLLELTTPRVLLVRRGRWLPHLSREFMQDAELLQALIQCLHAGGWRARLAAGWAVVSGFLRLLRGSSRSRP